MAENSNTVWLVGSVPLNDAADVLATVSKQLGTRIMAIPDGETGIRKNWISWQKQAMDAAPMLEVRAGDSNPQMGGMPRHSLRAGYTGPMKFGALGYAQCAIESYAVFARMQAEGKIPAATRFQVSLPTPLAPILVYIAPADQPVVEKAYVAAMKAEVEAICAAIPHDKLAIQWDTALEFAVLEKVFPSYIKTVDEVLVRLVELSRWVPASVAMGYHLCYGDAGHKHFKEPDDSSLLVKVINELSQQVQRPLHWFHLPVPIERHDDAYFAPLDQLKTSARVFLGLVHARDGKEGALRRAATARRHLASFGIATECGLGRRAPETIPALLALHAEIADAL